MLVDVLFQCRQIDKHAITAFCIFNQQCRSALDIRWRDELSQTHIVLSISSKLSHIFSHTYTLLTILDVRINLALAVEDKNLEASSLRLTMS